MGIRRGLIVSISAMSLLLSGCLPNSDKPEEKIVEQPDDKKEKAIISQEIQTTEKYYRSVLDKKGETNSLDPGAVRGLITDGVDNRLDVDELETGLMRIAQETFDPDKYFFKDGQLFDSKEIHTWLKRKSKTNEQGLNPALGMKEDPAQHEKVMEAEKANPRYLSYILEHNYYVKNDENKVALGGVVVGLSLYDIYPFSVYDDQGLKYTGTADVKNAVAKGKKAAEAIIKDIRTDEKVDVPIVVALFIEQPRDSIVPGNFVAKTVVDGGKASIDGWKEIDEKYYAFPSKDAEEAHPSDAEKFDSFKRSIQEFFPNFVGVVGTGLYRDDKLQRMKVEIPVQFYSKSEIISFTQFVTGLVKNKKDTFPQDLPVSVYITSMNKPESIIVKDPHEEEPFVHIYQ
ncbi:CamS family sex pheromone protein [Pseudalkalibacillus caeni]|uniref:CamS family sex pheromone protein n=1 Tax=Exobacillus caeni TaxID=2574798 RepID=A0A5R9F001_9BACL|nr:CamS family sex pheromone protein [Pseudalkalibacillus caeni]TLS36029.1 CamS family sex pheromone protein [Pseudalkalibacillus caeni]